MSDAPRFPHERALDRARSIDVNLFVPVSRADEGRDEQAVAGADDPRARRLGALLRERR